MWFPKVHLNKTIMLLQRFGLTFHLASKIHFPFLMFLIHFFSMANQLSYWRRANFMDKLRCMIYSKLQYVPISRIMDQSRFGIWEEMQCLMLIQIISIWFSIQQVRFWFSRANNLSQSNTWTHSSVNLTFSKRWHQEILKKKQLLSMVYLGWTQISTI